jgi:uracil-DNA glycosylase
MKPPISKIHHSWLPVFDKNSGLLIEIFDTLDIQDVAPIPERIFRAFEAPLDSIRVVIFGQDPYPGRDVADGLAFSSPEHQPIPASLRNIFKEYHSDLGLPIPGTPDLSRWSKSGVMLLNRTLTTTVGERNAHLGQGWSHFTYQVAEFLAQRDVVAILWGSYARELASLFKYKIESAHPSPLSAYRGFFGSKPFTSANQLLDASGRELIDWRLK